MAIPYQEFESADVDVGAGFTETFLNQFAVAHHRTVPSAYTGTQEFNDFDQKLTVSYTVANPLHFDLAPITAARFRQLWFAHLKSRGSTVRAVSDLVSTPPNVKVTTSKMEFDITVYKADGTPDFDVPFVWDLEAMCGLLLVDQSDGKAVKLQPLKVTFSLPSPVIEKEISSKLAKALRKGRLQKKHPATGGGDDVWCLKLEKLILFILNQVLSRQMVNFLVELQLPRAVELIEGVRLQPYMIEATQDSLLVGARVIPTAAPLYTDVRVQAEAVMLDYNRMLAQEVNSGNKGTDPTPSLRWLKDKVDELEKGARQAIRRRKTRSRSRPAGYPENVYVLSNDNLFKALARTYLNMDRVEEYTSPEFLGFRATAGWWMKLDNGDASVVRQGVQFSARFAAGAHAAIQVRNFWDPKHWGEWEDLTNLCIDIRISRFQVDAIPMFKPDGIYLSLLLGGGTNITAHWCGTPPGVIPGELLDWILTKIAQGLFNFLRVVLALIQIKVATYPTQFPGTSLPWNPRFNAFATNNGPYLTFSGDPTFQ